MPYITSVERIGRELGRAEGLREGLALALEAKFGGSAAAAAVVEAIRRCPDVVVLERVVAALRAGAPLEDVRALVATPEA